MENSEIGDWLKFFVLCIFGLSTAVVFFFFFNRNSIFTKAAGAQATLSFSPSTISAKKDSIVSTKVMLQVTNAYIRGSDVKIVFDPSRLVLIKVSPFAQEQTALKTYLPLNEGQDFDEISVIRHANSEGVVEFSAVAADTKNKYLTQTATGKMILAELSFVAKKEGVANVAFLTNHPTLDSSVVQDESPPVNILTGTNLLMIKVEGITPTPKISPISQ